MSLDSHHTLEIVHRNIAPSPWRGAGRPAAPAPSRPLSGSKFRSLGEFLVAVAKRDLTTAKPDPRLTRAPSGLHGEDPTAGGFLIPDVFTEQLIASLYQHAEILPLTDRRTTDKPSRQVSLPAIDETSRADGSRSGGTISYWDSEGIAPPTTLPKFRSLAFAARKLVALCLVTEELFRDDSLLESHLLSAFGAEAAFQCDKCIVQGTGAGQPLGIVAAPGTITVAKAVGQAAATINADNIVAMWSRLPAPCRRRAVWLLSEDAEAQLDSLGSGGGSAATNGMYFPAGANGNEFALIKGRPVIVSEVCAALGTPGDIVLADLSQYVVLDGGMRSAVSLECEWLTFQGAFRFAYMVDSKPIWPTPIASWNGSGISRSPFVILAQR